VRPRLLALEEQGEGGATIGGSQKGGAASIGGARRRGLHAPTRAHQMPKATGSTGGLADAAAVEGRNGADGRRIATSCDNTR
jgi:hypothetical protein